MYNKKHMNGFLTLTWSNLKSAFVYGVLTSTVTFVLVVGTLILSHGSIYGIDWANVIDKAAIAVIGILVAFVSVLKNLLTDSQGKFLGAFTVIPDKSPLEK